MRKRTSEKISINLKTKNPTIPILINVDLFEWVIENIIKNSIDAISQKGEIMIEVSEKERLVIIDVIDNGRGIKKSFFNEIFKPGVTSKKRGWGLGLSLVKRIIKDYHKGEVKIQKSIPNTETVLRIVLNK